MSAILSSKDGVKAKKRHQCCFCFEMIEVGEVYNYRAGAEGGDFWTMHMHPECDALADATFTRDDYYDLSDKSFDRPKPIESSRQAEGTPSLSSGLNNSGSDKRGGVK